MINEQKLIKDILDKIGEDRLDKYAETFNSKSLWYCVEKEVIMNETFKEILEIFSKYNSTPSIETFSNVYEAESCNIAFLVTYLLDEHIHKGSISIFNRATIFCYLLYLNWVRYNIKPSETLKDMVIEKNLVNKRRSFKARLLYMLRIYDTPYEIWVERKKAEFISVISGKDLNTTYDYLISL